MPARARVIALVAWFGAACVPALACVNTFEPQIHMALARGDRAYAEEVVARLEAAYKQDPTLENSNDLAVGWLLLGKKSEAIAMLRDVERIHPGEAIVAANLGTALELTGDDAEALHWIREGVRRDPDEHFGSEWLHARILEVKIAAASDANWFEKNTVLGIDFGTAAEPQVPATLPQSPRGKPLTKEQLVNAISYQLGERTRFVKPPDAIVGDLYSAAGNLAWLAGQKKTTEEYLGVPVDFYESALEYGAPRKELVELRKAAFNATFSDTDWIPDPHATERKTDSSLAVLSAWRWPLIVVGLLAVFGGVFYFARFRKP
jgi:tetratricopeptide (TPR) repeat protein